MTRGKLGCLLFKIDVAYVRNLRNVRKYEREEGW